MKVLVVENDPTVLKVVSTALRKDQYLVDSAPDGSQGLCKAISGDYDAITLDMMLPELSGRRILSSVRQSKQTPIRLLSALYQIADLAKALESSADDCVAKLFALSELKARLKTLIR